MLEILNLFWGFILTKWYVKAIKPAILGRNSFGFILTKWYVKFDVLSDIDRRICEFYIN